MGVLSFCVCFSIVSRGRSLLTMIWVTTCDYFAFGFSKALTSCGLTIQPLMNFLFVRSKLYLRESARRLRQSMEVPAIWTDRRISRKTADLPSFDLHLSRLDIHQVDMAAMPLWKSSRGQLYEYVFTDRSDILVAESDMCKWATTEFWFGVQRISDNSVVS